MKHVYNDGGRSEWKDWVSQNVGDCVTRSIAIALNADYGTIYDAMTTIRKKLNKKDPLRYRRKYPRNGMPTHTRTFSAWMGKQNFKKVKIKQGGVRVKDLNFENQNVIVYCQLKNRQHHYTAIINNEIHDTWDCGDLMAQYYWVQK